MQIALGYAESFKKAKSEAQRAQDARNSRIIKSDSEASLIASLITKITQGMTAAKNKIRRC